MTKRAPGRPRHADILTPAEWRVVEQVRHGMTSRRIAERSGISRDAVKFHIGNALGKLGFSSRDELRRWNGVGADSALARLAGTKGMTAMGEENDAYVMLGQVARSASDFAAAREWYRDKLGLPELYVFGNLAFFDLGGVRLMLTEEQEGKSDSLLYFQVPNIHARMAALEQRGVEFTHAPHRIHVHEDGSEEWMAFFLDNEGRPLALMSRIGASSAVG